MPRPKTARQSSAARRGARPAPDRRLQSRLCPRLKFLRPQSHLCTLYPTPKRRPLATVINTSDDLLKLLAENAEFYQAVRRLILTDELIELPERFARFAARVDDFIARQERFNEEQRQFNQRIETAVGELQGTTSRLEASVDELQNTTARLETSVGALKGNPARYAVAVLFEEIAEHLGFTFRDTLSRQQLRQMIGPQGRTDVCSGDRLGFIRADLVVVAADAAGDTHYVAVEASYTGDARDTARARRNARLLQRFTGCPAHAAIASVRNDQDIQAEIDGGEVHWYALDPDDFTPE